MIRCICYAYTLNTYSFTIRYDGISCGHNPSHPRTSPARRARARAAAPGLLEPRWPSEDVASHAGAAPSRRGRAARREQAAGLRRAGLRATGMGGQDGAAAPRRASEPRAGARRGRGGAARRDGGRGYRAPWPGGRAAARGGRGRAHRVVAVSRAGWGRGPRRGREPCHGRARGHEEVGRAMPGRLAVPAAGGRVRTPPGRAAGRAHSEGRRHDGEGESGRRREWEKGRLGKMSRGGAAGWVGPTHRRQRRSPSARPRSRVWGRGAGAGLRRRGEGGAWAETRDGPGGGRVCSAGPRYSSAGLGRGGEVRERGRGPPRPAGPQGEGEGWLFSCFLPFIPFQICTQEKLQIKWIHTKTIHQTKNTCIQHDVTTIVPLGFY
jgi:hypothetical protein